MKLILETFKGEKREETVSITHLPNLEFLCHLKKAIGATPYLSIAPMPLRWIKSRVTIGTQANRLPDSSSLYIACLFYAATLRTVSASCRVVDIESSTDYFLHVNFHPTRCMWFKTIKICRLLDTRSTKRSSPEKEK